MKYLLDTDHITILQRQSGADYRRLSQRLDEISDDDLTTSIVSLHEQLMGCHAYLNRSRNLSHLVDGYSMMNDVFDNYKSLTVLDFDDQAAHALAQLNVAKIRIGAMDLRIAATALSRNLTLLTRNSSDFGKVPGLSIEDWTQ